MESYSDKMKRKQEGAAERKVKRDAVKKEVSKKGVLSQMELQRHRIPN